MNTKTKTKNTPFAPTSIVDAIKASLVLFNDGQGNPLTKSWMTLGDEKATLFDLLPPVVDYDPVQDAYSFTIAGQNYIISSASILQYMLYTAWKNGQYTAEGMQTELSYVAASRVSKSHFIKASSGKLPETIHPFVDITSIGAVSKLTGTKAKGGYSLMLVEPTADIIALRAVIEQVESKGYIFFEYVNKLPTLEDPTFSILGFKVLPREV